MVACISIVSIKGKSTQMQFFEIFAE